MAQTRRATRSPRPPLDGRALRDLALAYAARYATTRARLAAYLGRKLRERGWDGQGVPDPRAIAEEFAASGYIDDAAFATQRAGSLARRGYGPRRIAVALHQAGIAPELRAETLDAARDGSFAAALHLARKRRFGPFGETARDPAQRQRQIAAMIRAGHGFDVARRIIDAPNPDSLDEGA